MKKHLSIKIILMLMAFVLSTSCAGSEESYHFVSDSEKFSDQPTERVNKNDDISRKYRFHKQYEGEEVYWKVNVEDGKITKLYKDGEKIPQNEISRYEDFLMPTIKSFDEECEIQDEEMAELKDDMKKLKEEKRRLKHKIHFNSDTFDSDFNFDINFDEEEFERGMEKLGEALENLNINFDLDFDCDDDGNYSHHFEWDSDDFKSCMKKLKENLKELDDLDVHININMEDFSEGMKEVGESMKNLKVDMSGLKDDMQKMKVELKKLKNFMVETTEELVADGYIIDKDEEYDLELNMEEMIVNDKKVPAETHQKYLEIYKKHFGHYPEDNVKFNR